MSVASLHRLIVALLLIVIGWAWSPSTHAANPNVSCNVTGIDTPMAFGPVDPNNSQTDTTTTIHWSCNNTGGTGTGTVCFTIGDGLTTRNMTSGANNLQFGVFADAARSTFWGNNATTNSIIVTPIAFPAGITTGIATIYGRVTAGQTTAVSGSYSYSFGATVTQISIATKPGNGGAATNCSAPDTGYPTNTNKAFTATATVTAICSVTGGTLDFGSKTGGTNVLNATGSTTFTVTCVNGHGYTIGMSPAGGSTNGTGNMTNGTTSDTVSFKLCQDSTACGTAWGNVTVGLGANVESGTGSGSAQTYNVYGKVTAASPASGFVKPVTYSNATTITVTY